MAPTTSTMFAAGTGKRKLHNHIFGHRARRGVAINMSTPAKAIDASAPAKDYPLFVPPKSALPTASGTFAVGQPTDSLPTSPMENFLVHTITSIAVGFAIIVVVMGLVVAGVTLKRTILKRRNRRHRRIRGGSSKGRTDPAEKKQEDNFDEKSPDSPASSLQKSLVSVKSPTLHLEHEACSPVQSTPRPSWFARVFRKAPTGRKNVESPKETSPFLGKRSAELSQQTTWSEFSSPESLIHSMPLLHHVPEECKDVRENSVAFASQATSTGLRSSKAFEASTVEEAYKEDKKDVQEVGAPSVSIERIVGSSGEEERSYSEMVDMGSKLVPRASSKTVGIGETGKLGPRDARVSDEEYADVGQGYSGVFSGRR